MNFFRFIYYGIIVLVGAFAVSFVFFYTENLPSRDETNLTIKTQSSALSPYLKAFDAHENPYCVKAKNATLKTDNNTIHLEEPCYEITFKNGKTLKIQSTIGFFNNHEKNLHLEGNVILNDSEGYRLESYAVDILLDKGYAEGHTSLTGKGENMSFTSGSFQIYNKGNTIILTKNPILKFQLK